jgi:hypothetical protein
MLPYTLQLRKKPAFDMVFSVGYTNREEKNILLQAQLVSHDMTQDLRIGYLCAKALIA